MAGGTVVWNLAWMLVFQPWLMVALIGQVASAVDETPIETPCEMTVDGPLNLTPDDARLLALALLIAVGVLGLVCVLLFAVACGYRSQANDLYSRLQNVEKGPEPKVKSASRPPTLVHDNPDADLPLPPPPPLEVTLPPPPSPPPPPERDIAEKIPIPDSPVSDAKLQDITEEAMSDAASVEDNPIPDIPVSDDKPQDITEEAMSDAASVEDNEEVIPPVVEDAKTEDDRVSADEDVTDALSDMDAALEGADTASAETTDEAASKLAEESPGETEAPE